MDQPCPVGVLPRNQGNMSEEEERGLSYSSPTAARKNRDPGGEGTPQWNAVQVFLCSVTFNAILTRGFIQYAEQL